MRFFKAHGCGNDYVFVDCRLAPVPGDAAALARRISDRRTGVGSDGLILLDPPTAGGVLAVRIFNADGSAAEMCGNGLRCVGRWLRDRGEVGDDPFVLDTPAGPRTARVRGDLVRVEMGVPAFTPPRSAATGAATPPPVGPHGAVTVGGGDAGSVTVHLVSVGNPHAVLFPDAPATDDLVRTLGPRLERHPAFPGGVNAGFAFVESRDRLRLRVWERGSGETAACGTGACAAVVAAVATGRTDRTVTVALPGGELTIERPADDGPVWMTGPAVVTFAGEWRGGE